ncbi:hypothetical protein MnTg02_03000 [bacterium MnTg02]|nr:hypothetical protein MnTg02_03000 [bacterium MnTg02]
MNSNPCDESICGLTFHSVRDKRTLALASAVLLRFDMEDQETGDGRQNLKTCKHGDKKTNA